MAAPVAVLAEGEPALPLEVAAASAIVRDGGGVEEAIALLDGVIARLPACAEAHALRGMVLLSLGRFEDGFAAYEWRHRIPGHEGSKPALPRWNGEPLPGKTLLLWDEQGFGDNIQFARFVERAARSAQARIVLHVHPAVRRLMASCRGADAVEAREGRPPFAHAQLSLLSIPAALRLRAADLPAEKPWLTPEQSLAEGWRRRLDVAAPRPRPRIGIAWQGNPLHPRDGRRSLPLAAFAPVVRAWAERAAFISLQKGPASDAIAAAALPLIDFGADLDGGYDAFVDTAAAMSALDLVITSDTSVAHLAAALGVPVWVVLGRPCDWRWGREGACSIFYPNARLFRQRVTGEWSGAMEQLACALEAWFVTGQRRTT
jgi:hypothetical protein